ncbi:hypothetical protein [uncultured Winogradskyella sp.]|uniref:hypothetical protein n=1 Tax=uncultured Winogradskyella sp. TaxID=395353 RepID=UPI0030D75444|tara:strand:+ start:49 stop:600 length:552 start_codon:yes stop_codon:yes gene_type:complete
MDKLHHKLTKGLSKSLDKGNSNKSLILGSLIATFLAFSPFLFTIYESVPSVKTWSTSWFTYDSTYYENVQVFAWTITTKLIPLIFITLWFLTNRHWWYHALLVPMAMYIYQLIIIINDDNVFADTDEQKLYLVPVMAIVIPSIYLIRAKMFNKLNDADKTLEELEEEFMIKPSTFWGKIKQYF